MRFGMSSTSTHSKTPASNQLQLETEIGDFMAMVRLLTEEYNLNMDNIIAAADAKLVKVEKFMKNKKGLDAAELAAVFSRNKLAPLPSFDKPHRRNPKRKTR